MILNKNLYDKYFSGYSFLRRISYIQKTVVSLFRSRIYLLENNYNVPMLNTNDKGYLCTACGLCEDICPSNCIITEKKNSGSNPLVGEVKRFDLDFNKCIQCYKCEEVCPEKAIELRFVEIDKKETNFKLSINHLTFDSKENSTLPSSKKD